MKFRAPHDVHDPAVGPELKSGLRTELRSPHAAGAFVDLRRRRQRELTELLADEVQLIILARTIVRGRATIYT